MGEKGEYRLQLMCVDQLSQIRSVESIDALIAAYKKEEKGDAQLRGRLEQSLIAVWAVAVVDVVGHRFLERVPVGVVGVFDDELADHTEVALDPVRMA